MLNHPIRFGGIVCMLATCAAAASCGDLTGPGRAGGKIPDNTWDKALAIVYRSDAPDDRVQNGRAYDKARLDLSMIPGFGRNGVVVIPKDARLEQVNEGSVIELFMVKELDYVGHGERMSIVTERRKMGCVWRLDKAKLEIGTYGEWDSNIEGGAGMGLLVRVPQARKVERREGLMGPIIWPQARFRGHRTSREPTDPGHDAWKAIPHEPDPKRTADAAPEK